MVLLGRSGYSKGDDYLGYFSVQQGKHSVIGQQGVGVLARMAG